MKIKSFSLLFALGLMAAPSLMEAQTAYGVTGAGSLFSFDVNAPASTTPIGSLGIVPEGIDFRPGTGLLYAIDVGPTTTQLYTVNLSTAAVTPVGVGFPSQVTGTGSGDYDLTNSFIGFDFNPRTLQADGSVRIRVVSSNGTNLRLNSDTGQVAAVDTRLDYPDADPNAAATPRVDAAAYINSATSTVAAAGTTTLFVMDSGTDDLSTQNPPNAGNLNTIGPFGPGINSLFGIGFDIFTDPLSVDDGIGGDLGFAVLTRMDTPRADGIVPVGTPPNPYLLYDVNLATGAITNGALVGGGLDFVGGFAVVPEPSIIALALVGLGLVGWRIRRLG